MAESGYRAFLLAFPRAFRRRLGDDIAEAFRDGCWKDESVVDVFGADGRYLGGVDLPDGMTPSATTFFVDGRRVVAAVKDDAEVVRVKLYRLVLPRGE